MTKFFVMLSVVFVMAFGFVGNASADEALDEILDDFFVVDNVWNDTETSIVRRSIALPFAATHDVVKSLFFGLTAVVGGTGYVAVKAGEVAVEKLPNVGGVVIESYTSDTFVEENLQARRDIISKSVIVAPALIFDAIRGTGNLMENSLSE